MASKYIYLYVGNPTSGGTDGTKVTQDDDYTSAVTATLDASKNESAQIKLAARCDAGYTTTSDGATVTLTGDTAAKWKLCYSKDFVGNDAPTSDLFGDTCTLPQVGTTNVIFWALASASDDEVPHNDKSVHIVLTAQIIAADAS